MLLMVESGLYKIDTFLPYRSSIKKIKKLLKGRKDKKICTIIKLIWLLTRKKW